MRTTTQTMSARATLIVRHTIRLWNQHILYIWDAQFLALLCNVYTNLNCQMCEWYCRKLKWPIKDLAYRDLLAFGSQSMSLWLSCYLVIRWNGICEICSNADDDHDRQEQQSMPCFIIIDMRWWLDTHAMTGEYKANNYDSHSWSRYSHHV